MSMQFPIYAVLLTLSMVLAGCVGLAERPKPDAAGPSATPGATSQPKLQISQNEDSISARRRQLIEAGIQGLASEQTGYYLDIQEARFRQAFTDTDFAIQRKGEQLTLVLPGAGMFATGSTDLSAQVEEPLGKIADILAEYDKTLVEVEGHTDSAGDRSYNQRLSKQRALSVAKRLAAKGIEPQRLIVVGRGESQPAADNDTEAGRARNRRVTLTLHPIRAALEQVSSGTQ